MQDHQILKLSKQFQNVRKKFTLRTILNKFDNTGHENNSKIP